MACYGSMVVRNKWGEPFEVPCGQCIGCRLERARQWAVRCVHEAQMHDENCFITLTYNNDNLPEDKSVHKRHLQLFFKRLRRKIGKELRYYACGEYGDRLGRPHYHACIFGVDFHDKTHLRGSNYRWHRNHFKKGHVHDLYRSTLLEDRWPYGYSTVGELTFESAGYVARYCTKKITGEKSKDHYGDKNPEFALMSSRPGIGYSWYQKYKTDVYPKDFFTINGVKNKPPRYYDDLLARDDPMLLEDIKFKRSMNCTEENSHRKAMKAKHRKLITKPLNRSLHHD